MKVFLPMAAILAAALGVCLAVVSAFQTREIEALQERNAARLLELGSELIRDRYDDLADRRLDAIMDQRAALRRELTLFMAGIESLHDQERQGNLTRAQAQAAAVEAARLAASKSGVNIFAFDQNFTGIIHADKSLAGISWRGLKSVTGSNALENAAKVVARDGTDTLLLWWPGGDSGVESKHLARLALFTPWGWHVGASMDYGRLEARSVQDRNQTVREIVDSLARVRLGETGRVFVLDTQNMTFLLPPPGGGRMDFAADVARAVSQSGGALARLDWNGPGAPGKAFCVFLPGTGWHLGVTVESSELGQAPQGLAMKEASAFALILALALALAWAVSGRITRPLARLAAFAASVDPKAGVQAEDIARLRRIAEEEPGEAAVLARTSADVLDSLNSAIRDLEASSLSRERSAQDLEESKAALERLNEELESRVRLRTAALEAANQRLKSSEARYRGLFTDSPVPFLELDLSALAAFMRSPEVQPVCDLEALFRSNPDFAADCSRLVTILNANPAALELTGCDSRAELAVKAETARIPEGLSLFSRMDQAISQGAASFTCEISPGDLPGGERHCSVTLRPLPGHERALDKVLVAVQDITEIRRGEERLRAAHAEARAASKAKSEFLANMSHEIRTPISAILGLAELSTRQPDQAKTMAHMSMISDAAQSLLEVVGDVLDLARMESGRVVLDCRPFTLEEALGARLEAAAVLCGRKGLAFDSGLPAEPATLLGDPVRLGQLVGKLLDNAVKFTQAGSVRLDAELRPGGAEAELLIRVRDTGEGVPPEQAQSIFESFRQADSSFSKRHQGAGLGLAICRELAALMGGRLWVEEQQGPGSDFRFSARFPLARGREAVERPRDTGTRQRPAAPAPVFAPTARSAAHGSEPRPGSVPERRLRVLIAEDNPVNRHVFTEFLTSLGHIVMQAADGHEALEIVRDGGVEFVFMDVQMPRLDGVEAVRRMREGFCGERAAGLPVVALTAYAMEGDRERFLAAGMSGYLAKPVTLKALRQTLCEFDPRTVPSPDAQETPPGELAPLMAEFATYVRTRAAEAEKLLEEGNLAEAARAGHDVKGTSMAFGVHPVNKAGAALEAACRAGDARAAREALKGVYEALSEFEKAPPTSPLSMA